MKTVIRFFFVVMYMTLMIACNKTEQLINVSPDMDLKSAPIECQVITVLPNGYDDTEALQQAFHDALPGSVVQLGEGTYYLDFMEIREFYGTFSGAGKGKTVITTVADLEDDLIISQNLKVVLLKFVGGDVCMKDMTFMTSPGPLSPGVNRLNGIVHFCSRNAQYNSEEEYINVVVNNVEISGHWENTTSGIKVETDFQNTISGGIPLSHVDISVTNCSFNGVSDYGVLIQFVKEGKIVIGTKNNGNIFDNNSWAGLGLWSNVNVDVLVEGNTFINPTGTRYAIDLNNSPRLPHLESVQQTNVTVYNIEQNEFNLTGGKPKVYEAAIYTEDLRRTRYPEETPALVHVKNNKFNLIDNPYSVFRTFHMSGMVIRNNQLSGNGQYGVMIRATNSSAYNENGLMLGNNLSNTTFSVASVWLSALSRNWTIVGGNLGETIKDDTNGAGNHIITGFNVNTSEVPPGQTIVDNLEEMRDALHLNPDNLLWTVIQ